MSRIARTAPAGIALALAVTLSACGSSGGDVARWAPLDARGTLYSWTRIHAAPAVFAAEAPYAVGIVDLSCGIRLACRLVEVDGAGLAPGVAIEMVVLDYEDGPLFVARPCPAG